MKCEKYLYTSEELKNIDNKTYDIVDSSNNSINYSNIFNNIEKLLKD